MFRLASRESFGFRILSAFIAVIVLTLAAFTLFAALREGHKIKQGLREQGRMLAEVLADSVRVGVYAENRSLLLEAAHGIQSRKDVIAVSIYNAALNTLYTMHNKPEKSILPVTPDMVSDLGIVRSLRIVEKPASFEFFAPVMLQPLPLGDDTIYFNDATRSGPGRVIGFVRIALSTDAYSREIASVVLQHIIILLVFVTSSIAIVSIAVRKITRPLKNLTEKVQALGAGQPVEPASVETKDEFGNLASAFNAMVEARRRAEESLRLSEHRFRLIAETITEVFWISDVETGRLLYVSPGYNRVWGRSPEILYETPRSFLLNVHPEDRRRVAADLAAQREGLPFDREYRIIRPDGAVRLIWDRGYPVADETGKVNRYVGVAQDITERKGMEDKMRHYQRELRAAALELSSLETRIEERERHLIAADLHDYVGQNLVVSNFKLGSLKKSLADPNAVDRLEEVRELLAKVIAYTRSLTVELSPPVLAELGFTAAVRSLAEGFHQAHGIPIAVQEDGPTERISEDARNILYRSVRELLMNVVKHADASSVKIAIQKDRDIMRITVADDGKGFVGQSEGGSKSGFGLFTIRERMKRLDGSFSIESKAGWGTMAVLTVPNEEQV